MGEVANESSDERADDDNGSSSLFGQTLCGSTNCGDKLAAPDQTESGFRPGGFVNGGRQSHFDRFVEHNDAQVAICTEVGLNEPAGERSSGMFCELFRISCSNCCQCKGFKDRFHVEDTDTFAQEVLEDFLDLSDTNEVWYDFIDKRRACGSDTFEELHDLIA